MVKAKKAGKGTLLKKRPPLDVFAYPVIPLLSDEQKAARIVGHVLVHFGAGYGAQRQTETPAAPPANLPIFQKPSDLATFHFMLLESTVRNFAALNWESNAPLRDQVTRAAFKHGMQARQKVVADGTGTLKIDQIITTLRAVQASDCPPGTGGGPICDF